MRSKYNNIILHHSLTHSLTHTPTHSLTHLLTHSLTCTPTPTPTHSLTHSLAHPHPLTYLHTHPLTHSLTHLFPGSNPKCCNCCSTWRKRNSLQTILQNSFKFSTISSPLFQLKNNHPPLPHSLTHLYQLPTNLYLYISHVNTTSVWYNNSHWTTGTCSTRCSAV